jgi:hypothetical protein
MRTDYDSVEGYRSPVAAVNGGSGCWSGMGWPEEDDLTVPSDEVCPPHTGDGSQSMGSPRPSSKEGRGEPKDF